MKNRHKSYKMIARLLKAGSKRKYAYWAFRDKPLFGLKWPKIIIDTNEFNKACKGVTDSFKRLSEAAAMTYGLKNL